LASCVDFPIFVGGVVISARAVPSLMDQARWRPENTLGRGEEGERAVFRNSVAMLGGEIVKKQQRRDSKRGKNKARNNRADCTCRGKKGKR